MRLDEFDFDLPRERIAQQPASPRDSAKLLVVGNGNSDCTVSDLPDILKPGDMLVVNETKVIPVQLFGRRGAAAITVTLHTDLSHGRWRAFAKPGRRLREGDRVVFADSFSAIVDGKAPNGDITLDFECTPAELFEALEAHGAMPLPPYIRRDGEGQLSDRENYQTMFAAQRGAIAAPTAGLHFTPSLMDRFASRGIGCTRITLHVGIGTFLPVKVERLEDHRMHSEYGIVSARAAAAINSARGGGGRIVAVGTTCVRLLESAVDESGIVHPFEGDTDLFITPGWRFRAIDLMMTNFHLPKSTLFALVCAYAGHDRMLNVYQHAIEMAYRFYSYGDACLLSPERQEK